MRRNSGNQTPHSQSHSSAIGPRRERGYEDFDKLQLSKLVLKELDGEIPESSLLGVACTIEGIFRQMDPEGADQLAAKLDADLDT